MKEIQFRISEKSVRLVTLPALDLSYEDRILINNETTHCMREISSFAGKWVARGKDGAVLEAAESLLDLANSVRKRYGAETQYIPEKVESIGGLSLSGIRNLSRAG